MGQRAHSGRVTSEIKSGKVQLPCACTYTAGQHLPGC